MKWKKRMKTKKVFSIRNKREIHMRNFFRVNIGLLLFVTLLTGCTSKETAKEEPGNSSEDRNSSQNEIVILIRDFRFEPEEVIIKAGTEVTWRNEDGAPHSVISADGSFESDNLSPGDSFSFKFQKTGEYEYQCGIHPSMIGKIVVEQ